MYLNPKFFRLAVYFPLEIQPSKEFMFYLRLFAANEEDLDLLKEDTMSYFHKRISDSKKSTIKAKKLY